MNTNTALFRPDVVRPSGYKEGQITFAWRRPTAAASDGVIVEVVYDPQAGFRLAIAEGGEVRYAAEYKGLKPLPLLQQYVTLKTVRFPNAASPYGNVATLARQMHAFIKKYFDCEPGFLNVAVLWALQSWVYEACSAVPYLRLVGPPFSGKSRGSQTIGAICNRPVVVTGASTSSNLYRIIELLGGTIIIDEADFEKTGIGNDIAKILNLGYERNNPVMRNVAKPDGDFIPTPYDVFGPKVISGRRRFRDAATETRAIMYSPVSTGRTDIPKLLPPSFEAEALEIRNQALQFRLDNLDTFLPTEHAVSGTNNRTNQIVLPMLEIAEMIERSEPPEPNELSYSGALLDFVRRQDQIARDVEESTAEFALLAAFLSWRGPTPPICSELAKAAINRMKTENPKVSKWLDPRKAGEILRDLGFTVRHGKRGSQVTIEDGRLEALRNKYGVYD